MHLVDTRSPVSEMMALSQLSHAVKAGNTEGVDQILTHLQGDYYILREGVFQGWTPVHCAAYLGCLHSLTTLLQENQSYVHLQTTKQRETPLHLASVLGKADCIDLLLQAGSNIKAKDAAGETVLHKAARSGKVECLRKLIGSGCDLSVANERGQTPADVAESCGHVDCGTYLRQALALQRKGLFPPYDPRQNQSDVFSQALTRDNDVEMDVTAHEEDNDNDCRRQHQQQEEEDENGKAFVVDGVAVGGMYGFQHILLAPTTTECAKAVEESGDILSFNCGVLNPRKRMLNSATAFTVLNKRSRQINSM